MALLPPLIYLILEPLHPDSSRTGPLFYDVSMGEEEAGPESAWWTAGKVVVGLVGLVSAVVGATALWSEEARAWYSNHGVMGWLLLAATVTTASIAIAILNARYVAALAELRRKYAKELSVSTSPDHAKTKHELRARQCASDIAAVERRLGAFMSGGEIRTELEEIPSGKYFSKKLSRAFEQLERDFDDKSKHLFDDVLSGLLNEAREGFFAYWGPVAEHLDGPDEIQGDRWDLQIIQPPGGPWSGQTGSQRWDAFYVFVRSLAPRLDAFLKQVDCIEAHLHRLRVEAGLEPKI